jgi:hypothetical protein
MLGLIARQAGAESTGEESQGKNRAAQLKMVRHGGQSMLMVPWDMRG